MKSLSHDFLTIFIFFVFAPASFLLPSYRNLEGSTSGSLFVHLFCAEATATTQAPPAAELQNHAPFATLAFTKAKILSGMKITDCDPSPLVPECDNGIAAARQIFRNVISAKNSLNSEFVPNFDKDTAFVQMSPSNYGINIETYKKFGIRYYFGETTLWAQQESRRRFDLFNTDDVKFLQVNFQVNPSDFWNGISAREARLFNDSIGLIIIGRSILTYGVDGAEAVKASVRYLRSRVKAVVVLNNDNTAVADSWRTLLESIVSDPPDVYIYNNDTADPALAPCRRVLGVLACQITFSYDLLNVVHLYTSDDHIATPTTTLTPAGNTSEPFLLAAESSSDLISGLYDRPGELDSTFFSDHEFLLQEATKAAIHDPVVGHMSIRMPAAGMIDGVFHCYKGECPIGTLRARALIHAFPGAHVSVSNSGGFRGPGWPAGDIRMSNIWEFNPFANTVVVLKASGYKIWEMMNVSISFYWGQDVYYHFGDRFLQGDGYEIDFDATKPQFTDRILRIRIRNPETGVLEPLERNKMYTVVTDSHLVTNMGNHAPVLQNLRRGETITYYPDLAQDLVARYLTDVGEYTNIYNNNLKSDYSGTVEPMIWLQTPLSCTHKEFWDAGIVTCMECPANHIQSPTDATQCVPEAEKSNAGTIIAIVLPIAFALLLFLAACLVYLEYRRRRFVRNTDFAPKEGELITIIFTDIRSSTKLWAHCPASMASALEIHHRVIRKCIAEFCAYEVKTIGDSFMIASNNVELAVAMAVKIQEQLACEPWPASIGTIYAFEGEIDEVALLHSVDDEPRKLVESDASSPFGTGIRVRIGIHAGEAEVHFDNVSKGYDYYGPAVNLAARIESSAQGGQILTSRAFSSLIQDTCASSSALAVLKKPSPTPADASVTATPPPPPRSYTLVNFAEAELPGIDGSVELIQITPNSQAHRVFLPDQIRKKTAVGENYSDRSDSTFDEAVKAYGILNDVESEGKEGIDSLNTYLTNTMSVRSYSVLSREVLIAVTRLMDETTRDKVVRALAMAWKVQNISSLTNKKIPNEDLLRSIANRAGPSVKRCVTALAAAPSGSGVANESRGTLHRLNALSSCNNSFSRGHLGAHLSADALANGGKAGGANKDNAAVESVRVNKNSKAVMNNGFMRSPHIDQSAGSIVSDQILSLHHSAASHASKRSESGLINQSPARPPQPHHPSVHVGSSDTAHVNNTGNPSDRQTVPNPCVSGAIHTHVFEAQPSARAPCSDDSNDIENDEPIVSAVVVRTFGRQQNGSANAPSSCGDAPSTLPPSSFANENNNPLVAPCVEIPSL